MSFIGVIASKKCFENIKSKIAQAKNETIKLIPINLRSIENVKNIKFETIIVEDKLKKFEKHQPILEKIFENTQYLLLNTDQNPEQKQIQEMSKTISYGLNQKAMVTVSSISETDILVYWQKNLKDKEGNKLEIEERRIKKQERQLLSTYEILIIDTLLKLYKMEL
ncbi:MAG: hypothetical protein HFJ33_00230 [Clostridia bacterium]|nr:hypothetical protein [Clostridia bacterium]